MCILHIPRSVNDMWFESTAPNGCCGLIVVAQACQLKKDQSKVVVKVRERKSDPMILPKKLKWMQKMLHPLYPLMEKEKEPLMETETEPLMETDKEKPPAWTNDVREVWDCLGMSEDSKISNDNPEHIS